LPSGQAKFFRRPHQTTAFRDGKLYRFESREITVITSWPGLFAFQKTKKLRIWVHCRPDIKVPCGNIETLIARISSSKLGDEVWPVNEDELARRRESARKNKLPYEERLKIARISHLQWCDTIPGEVRAVVGRFADRQYHLLSFIARGGKPALDLARANPALAYMLASNWIFHRPPVKKPLRSACTLLGRDRSQREALKWLRFPDSEAARKLLSGILPGSITIPALLYLKKAMEEPEVMKALAHLARINTGVIRIVTDATLRPLVTPSFLREVALNRSEISRPHAAYHLHDTLDMHRYIFENRRPFPPLHHLARLRELHDSLVAELAKVEPGTGGKRLPAPPVKGNATIIPITDVGALLEEGRLQKNCVGGYGRRIFTHHTFVYRMLAPARCTLSLVRVGNQWVLSELRMAGNEKAPREAWLTAEDWLKKGAGGDNDFPMDLPEPGQGTVENG